MVDIFGRKKRALHDKAVTPLIGALQDSDEGVRKAAAEALSKIGDARAVIPLADLMSEGDTNTGEVARLAFHDTIKASEENAVDPLVQLLQHPSPRVRREAAIELGDLATPALEGFGESLRGTLSTTGEVVGDKLQPVAEKAKDVGGQTAEKASEAIDSAKTKVAEAQREKPFGEWVRDTASAVGHRLHPVAEEAKDAGEHVAQAQSETLETGKEKISEEQRQMRERQGETVEAVTEKTAEVAEPAQPAAEKVVKTIREGGEQARDVASGTLQTKEKVDGATEEGEETRAKHNSAASPGGDADDGLKN